MSGHASPGFEEIGCDDGDPVERMRTGRATSSSSTSDTYSVAEPLSYDGRAVLYRGVRNTDRRPVILKVLDPRRSRPRDLEQLEHEYEIGKLFDSPAVVRPLALQSHDGMPALVMEDFYARPLEDLIDGPMGVERFLTLASRIAGAVAEVHRNKVVHRDLKPANIFVDPTGEVKLGDLGMASRITRGRSSLGSVSWIEGSLPYLSPEQTGRMNRSVDTRSDLYAIGVTFYEMLTGQLPFHASDPLSWVHCHVAHTPRPPREVLPEVPSVLSDIVLKLMAKLAEDRYQTAHGLQHDLELCLQMWRERGEIEAFPLGERDVSDRFEVAEKLYGREAEVAELFRAFDRVAGTGIPELVLVSGYSGIGKSALVRELHRPIAREQGFFISGKFDQYRRDIPYATFAQAFAELVDQLLSESEERLVGWKKELQQALGASAQLIVDIIPKLELILGPQSPATSLPPLEAQNRFHLVFRQFVGVFARKEHPLALFLDDLQWLDSGSLKLMEDVLLHPQTKNLLLLGAYRDNEVGPSHPLMLTLDAIRKAKVRAHEIVLAPLDVRAVGDLIADSLHCSTKRAAPLSRLVHEKTGGNPFFAIQFLTNLHQEGLLECDRTASEWRWNMAKIHAKGFTDNVLDLMSRRLSRLPAATRDALKLAACVGSSTDIHTLAVISDRSQGQTARDLWPAIAEGLVLQAANVYTFLHDRVLQAAYRLIGANEKRKVHLDIGRLMLKSLDPRDLGEQVFDVVSQLNRGVDLIVDPAERELLAKLDLMAGRKAKASIAYAAARAFLAAAEALLPEDVWESRYELAFPIFLERAECEYLCGAFEQAEASFEILHAHARTDCDRAAVYEIRMKLCQVAGKYDEAVALGLSALRLFGVEIPDDDEALERATRAEAEAVETAMGDRKIADLARAPEASDPRIRAIIDLLSNLAPPAYIGSRPKTFPLVILKLVNYSVRFGHTYESCMGYSGYGLILTSLFDDPRRAYEFSLMSIELNQRLADTGRRGTILHLHGDHINFWVNPIATDFPILERGFLACVDTGDLVYGNFIAFEIIWQAIERGDTLDSVLSFSEKYAAFAQNSRNEAVYQTIRTEQQFVACLKGRTRGPTSFEDDSFDERESVGKIVKAAFTCGVVFFHMMKLVAAYLAGDDVLALEHAKEARTTLRAAMAMPVEATFHYFEALLLARIHRHENEDRRREILATLRANDEKLAFWASICPENFLTKHALVSAEIARIEGDELEAERRYEQAIRSARESGFVHWEAIANELAEQFYRGRGQEIIAAAHAVEALNCYRRWGAEAKVEALESAEAQRAGVMPVDSSGTLEARTEHLDLLSVVKASQAISGVMNRDQLLQTILQRVLEEGGARHARLIVKREAGLAVVAEAAVEGAVERRPAEVVAKALEACAPVSVLQHVLRTQQPLVLDDAAIARRFESDPYFARTRPRAVLCLPLRRQAEVVALLYLENDLVPGAFTAKRVVALELLAAQAAISLENVLLLERERAGRTEAEGACERSLLLAEGTSLLSSTFDYRGVFAALTQLFVRSFADWAMIDLMEDGKAIRLAGAHRDPTKEPLIRELCERYPARIDKAEPVADVLRGGRPVYLPVVTDEQIRRFASDARHAELVVRLGSGSAIVVPLVARERQVGALTFVAAEPHRFSPPEIELAAELGRRIALAVDNARLLHETQRAIRLREDFLALASHELRTPLTTLRLTAEAMIGAVETDRPLPGEARACCLRRIVRETERLDDLGGELLDVTLIERDELSIHPSAFDLASLVHDVVVRLEPEIRAASCDVSVTGDRHVAGVWDRTRVDQLVAKLLSNAIKFGAGRPIGVDVREVDGTIRLIVEDQGIGIERPWLSRVFERFERGVPLTRYGGLGLGLYIARWIVRAHGGDIRVESTPGVGSRFIVDLPRVTAAPRPTPRESPIPARSGGM